MLSPLPICAYLGMFLCFIFIHFAQEEYKPGMPYFMNAMHALFYLSAFFFFILSPSRLFLMIGALLVVLYIFFSRYRVYLAYAFFILLSRDFFYVIIFAYGLCAGAALYKKPSALFTFAYYPILAMLLL